MTLTVNVNYTLSPAGQKAAIIAGRPATQRVTETMPLDDASLVEHLSVAPDGSLSINCWVDLWHDTVLDAPPVSVAEAVAANVAARARRAAEREAAEAQARAAKQAEANRVAAAGERDRPEVLRLLNSIEADPLHEHGAGESTGLDGYGRAYFQAGGNILTVPADLQDRCLAAVTARKTAAKAAEQAAAEAKERARQQMIETRGGYVFPVVSGMCSFLGFNLWSSGQTKRWVGVFSQPRGIDRFLDSPRNEFVFNVSSLEVGELIQGGGYDTNSRGKRRNESEWFGRVVQVSDAEIVVRIYTSRAAAMAAK